MNPHFLIETYSLPILELAGQLTNVKLMVYPCQLDFYVSMPENPGDEPIFGIKVEILEEFTFYPWSMHSPLLI